MFWLDERSRGNDLWSRTRAGTHSRLCVSRTAGHTKYLMGLSKCPEASVIGSTEMEVGVESRNGNPYVPIICADTRGLNSESGNIRSHCSPGHLSAVSRIRHLIFIVRCAVLVTLIDDHAPKYALDLRYEDGYQSGIHQLSLQSTVGQSNTACDCPCARERTSNGISTERTWT